MKITQINPYHEILPEEVKHGDIIKLSSKDERTGITTEKSGVVQFIVFNSRSNSYMFYTEGYREGYDNSENLLGGGRDVLVKVGHEVSPLDSAEVGDYFVAPQTTYSRNETIEKLEEGWWISRFKINNTAEAREIYSESMAREWFRKNNAKLVKADTDVVKSADGKIVSFSEGDKVVLTPRALEHSAFRGFDEDRAYIVSKVVGQSVEMYPVNSPIRYTVHESHLMKFNG